MKLLWGRVFHSKGLKKGPSKATPRRESSINQLKGSSCKCLPLFYMRFSSNSCRCKPAAVRVQPTQCEGLSYLVCHLNCLAAASQCSTNRGSVICFLWSRSSITSQKLQMSSRSSGDDLPCCVTSVRRKKQNKNAACCSGGRCCWDAVSAL